MERARGPSESADVADGRDESACGYGCCARSWRRPSHGRVLRRVCWLLDRLREGRGRKLTLVCAPAGYGKTTVLAQWCEADRQRTPFVWMSADEGDADPVRFWSHLIAGLQAVHPRAGTASRRGVARRTGHRRERRPAVAHRRALGRATVGARRRRLAPRSKRGLRPVDAHARRTGTPGGSGRALEPLGPEPAGRPVARPRRAQRGTRRRSPALACGGGVVPAQCERRSWAGGRRAPDRTHGGMGGRPQPRFDPAPARAGSTRVRPRLRRRLPARARVHLG